MKENTQQDSTEGPLRSLVVFKLYNSSFATCFRFAFLFEVSCRRSAIWIIDLSILGLFPVTNVDVLSFVSRHLSIHPPLL